MTERLKIIIFSTALIAVITLNGRDYSCISAYNDTLFILNGIEKKISVYDSDAKESKIINVGNISPSGFFDHFTVFDPYRSYLHDTVAGMIWQLDENFEVKDRISTRKLFGVSLDGYIFPVAYNSLIAASSEKDKIYLLRNSRLSELISFDSPYTDFRVFEDEIFVLYGDRIVIYSASAVYKKTIPLPEQFEKIRPGINKILLYADGAVTSLDRQSKVSTNFKTGDIVDLYAAEKYMIFIPRTELIPVRIDFE
jgi:hypothetical protein